MILPLLLWGWLLLAGSAKALSVSPRFANACSGNKGIDNFSTWNNKTNNLGAKSGDDNTMESLSVANETLTFKPKASSYFYENLPCENATASGYKAVRFHIRGPSETSLLLEVQTKPDCRDANHKSSYRNVSVPTDSNGGVVTISLSDFSDANLGAVTSLTFSTFNKTEAEYAISSIELVCGNS